MPNEKVKTNTEAGANLPQNHNREIFDDDGAAAYVGGIKARAIRDWRTHRGLPFLRLTHKTIRIRKVDLDKWLARQSVAITRGGCA